VYSGNYDIVVDAKKVGEYTDKGSFGEQLFGFSVVMATVNTLW